MLPAAISPSAPLFQNGVGDTTALSATQTPLALPSGLLRLLQGGDDLLVNLAVAARSGVACQGGESVGRPVLVLGAVLSPFMAQRLRHVLLPLPQPRCRSS